MNINELLFPEQPKLGADCYTVSRRGLVTTIRKHKIVGLLEHQGKIHILIDDNLEAIPREGYDFDCKEFLAGDPFFTNYRVNLDLKKYLTLEEAEAGAVKMLECHKRMITPNDYNPF